MLSAAKRKSSQHLLLTTGTLEQRWCLELQSQMILTQRHKTSYISSSWRQKTKREWEIFSEGPLREISHASGPWHFELQSNIFISARGFIFIFSRGRNRLFWSWWIKTTSVCNETRPTLLQKHALFAFNEALQFSYAAEATRICSLKRTNDVSPHPSLISYSLSLSFFLCCSSLEGHDEGVVSPPTQKLRKCEHCAQTREEYTISLWYRRRVSIFLICIQTSCCLVGIR